MNGTQNNAPASARLNVVGDIVWFAAASIAAGLTTALTAGALVMLLV